MQVSGPKFDKLEMELITLGQFYGLNFDQCGTTISFTPKQVWWQFYKPAVCKVYQTSENRYAVFCYDMAYICWKIASLLESHGHDVVFHICQSNKEVRASCPK